MGFRAATSWAHGEIGVWRAAIGCWRASTSVRRRDFAGYLDVPGRIILPQISRSASRRASLDIERPYVSHSSSAQCLLDDASTSFSIAPPAVEGSAPAILLRERAASLPSLADPESATTTLAAPSHSSNNILPCALPIAACASAASSERQQQPSESPSTTVAPEGDHAIPPIHASASALSVVAGGLAAAAETPAMAAIFLGSRGESAAVTEAKESLPTPTTSRRSVELATVIEEPAVAAAVVSEVIAASASVSACAAAPEATSASAISPIAAAAPEASYASSVVSFGPASLRNADQQMFPEQHNSVTIKANTNVKDAAGAICKVRLTLWPLFLSGSHPAAEAPGFACSSYAQEI